MQFEDTFPDGILRLPFDREIKPTNYFANTKVKHNCKNLALRKFLAIQNVGDVSYNEFVSQEKFFMNCLKVCYLWRKLYS